MPVPRKIRLAPSLLPFKCWYQDVDPTSRMQDIKYLTESKWTLLMRTRIITVGVQRAEKQELDTRESSTKLL